MVLVVGACAIVGTNSFGDYCVSGNFCIFKEIKEIDMATKKRTEADIKAEMAKLQAELDTFAQETARKEALATIEEKLAAANKLLEECASLARKFDLTFSWEPPMGGTMQFEGYWPDVDWNSSNCY
jgi:hypothetical protein